MQFEPGPSLTEVRYINAIAKYFLLFFFFRVSLYKRREENQVDATGCFITLIICSTCFGHLYVHHQELELLVLLPHMVCNALVAGGRLLGAEQRAMRPG